MCRRLLCAFIVSWCSIAWGQSLLCQTTAEGEAPLQPGQRLVIRSGTDKTNFQFVVQPAAGVHTQVFAIADGSETEVSSAPVPTSVQGRRIELINRAIIPRTACFAGGQIPSAAGKYGFHCQDNPSAIKFSLKPGEQKTLYSGTTPSALRIVNEPAAGYGRGLVAGLTGYSLEIPPSPAFLEVEDEHIDIFNRSAITLDGCSLAAPSESSLLAQARTPKVASQTISASVDNTGQHPGTAAVSKAATIMCLSAQSDLPNPQPAPSCYFTVPGFIGSLNRGQSAGTSGAGTVTLICNGQGNRLTCSGRVSQ
jgi:hypothetical protein